MLRPKVLAPSAPRPRKTPAPSPDVTQEPSGCRDSLAHGMGWEEEGCKTPVHICGHHAGSMASGAGALLSGMPHYEPIREPNSFLLSWANTVPLFLVPPPQPLGPPSCQDWLQYQTKEEAQLWVHASPHIRDSQSVCSWAGLPTVVISRVHLYLHPKCSLLFFSAQCCQSSPTTF